MLFSFSIPGDSRRYANISGTRTRTVSATNSPQAPKEKIMHRKHASKLAICLALFICLFATQALAKKLVVTNKTTKKIFISICYKDSTSNEWVVRGWFNVNPLSKNTIEVNTNNSIIYVHGNAGNTNWGCKGKSSSRTYAVVSSKFLYKKDKQRPQGDGYRNASFCETRMNSGGSFGFTFND